MHPEVPLGIPNKVLSQIHPGATSETPGTFQILLLGNFSKNVLGIRRGLSRKYTGISPEVPARNPLEFGILQGILLGESLGVLAAVPPGISQEFNCRFLSMRVHQKFSICFIGSFSRSFVGDSPRNFARKKEFPRK